MARTLGVPCEIAVQLVLEGVLDMRGVHAGDVRADTGSAGGGGAETCRVDATRTGGPFLSFLESKTETDGCRFVVDVCAPDVGAFEVGVLDINGLVRVCQLDVEFCCIQDYEETQNQLPAFSPGVSLFNVSHLFSCCLDRGLTFAHVSKLSSGEISQQRQSKLPSAKCIYSTIW